MQQAIVIVIVLAAAVYAVWHWMPGMLKRRAARAIADGSERLGVTDAEGAQKLGEALAAPTGCGACARCEPACASGSSGAAPAEATARTPEGRP